MNHIVGWEYSYIPSSNAQTEVFTKKTIYFDVLTKQKSFLKLKKKEVGFRSSLVAFTRNKLT